MARQLSTLAGGTEGSNPSLSAITGDIFIVDQCIREKLPGLTRKSTHDRAIDVGRSQKPILDGPHPFTGRTCRSSQETTALTKRGRDRIRPVLASLAVSLLVSFPQGGAPADA